jgi:assimilatory nitrate reductase catalytic subunit
MGGREVAGQYAGQSSELDTGPSTVVQDWGSPTICTKPGLKAVDLFEVCANGQIKALWVMSTNPAVSLPDSDEVAAVISKVPRSSRPKSCGT